VNEFFWAASVKMARFALGIVFTARAVLAAL